MLKSRFVKISSLFVPSFFDGILVPLALLYQINLRTYSPSTSCQRFGLCPSRSWWSWSLPALKIGRRSRARERKRSLIETFTNYQLIKDKIYLLKRSELAEMALPTGQRTSRRCWSGRSCSSGHEIERPVTHWLVRTEVSRLKEVG